jgi:hypothetical protein
MSAGFHGNNGLDPSTYIHILKTYVIPTITYGLEVLIPDKKNITMIWASVGSVQFNVISSAQAVVTHSMYPICIPNLDCCSCFNNGSMYIL